MSDDDLVAACRAGDGAAWAEVVERYQRLVQSIARAYGLGNADAEEIEQLTFTILLQNIDRLHEGTRLAPWLSVVARRHTWRLLESRRRESPNEIDDRSIVDDTQRSHEQLSANADWVRLGLRQLSSPCRALLEALYLRGETAYAEVAEELGVPIGSIGPTRARCLEKLRAILESTTTP